MTIPNRARSLLVYSLLLLTLQGCLWSGGRPDPELAARQAEAAEVLVDDRDYAGAARQMAEAVAADPASAAYALRYGELLEMSLQPGKALEIYRRTLTQLPPSDDLRPELVIHLGLVAALKLQQPQEAEKVLTLLDTDDPRRSMLQAALEIAGHDGRNALNLLNAVRSRPLEPPAAARVFYLAALAYQLLGDNDQAVGMLFQAINNAGRSQTAFEVEQLWLQLKGRNPHQ